MKKEPSNSSSKKVTQFHFTAKSDTSQLVAGKLPEDIRRMTDAVVKNSAFQINLGK